MIRLTYLHWYSQTPGALLLNPTAILAVTLYERDGVHGSMVTVQGYNYEVAESVDEIERLWRDALSKR